MSRWVKYDRYSTPWVQFLMPVVIMIWKGDGYRSPQTTKELFQIVSTHDEQGDKSWAGKEGLTVFSIICDRC